MEILFFFQFLSFFLVTLPGICGSSSDNVSLSRFTQIPLSLS